jgi:hypothetical protein
LLISKNLKSACTSGHGRVAIGDEPHLTWDIILQEHPNQKNDARQGARLSGCFLIAWTFHET